MRTLGRARALAVALFAISSAALADVSVQEQVEPGPVGGGDPFPVTVSVTGARRSVEVQLPAGEFRVLGKSHGTQMQITSGPSGMETTRTEQFIFTIAANREGQLNIPAAVVDADGAQLQGEPIAIDVQHGHPARPGSPDDDGDPFAQMLSRMQRMQGSGSMLSGPMMRRFFGGSDPFADPFGESPSAPLEVKPGDVRLEAVADRPSARPGEQVTVSYFLTARVPVSSITGLEIPAYDGAATRNIELGKQLTPEVENGVARVLIARRALFANAAGPLKIKSATAKVSVGDGPDAQEVSIASAPLTLAIVPLPPGPKNAAVGHWTLSLRGPAQARAGEPLTLRLVAQGTGDTSSLPEPMLSFPSAWKTFPPSTSETQSISGGRVGGTRSWELIAVPSGEGAATLGPASLPEFDPASGRFLEVKSEPLTIQIAPAAPEPARSERSDSSSASTLSSAASGPGARLVFADLLSWIGVAFLLLIAALLAAWVLRRKETGRDRGSPRPERLRDAEAALEEAHALCDSARAPDFFAALTRALNRLVAALGAPEAVTAELPGIVSALKSAGLPGPACESVSRALEACRRFAFLRATDSATLHRTLALADEAFSAVD